MAFNKPKCISGVFFLLMVTSALADDNIQLFLAEVFKKLGYPSQCQFEFEYKSTDTKERYEFLQKIEKAIPPSSPDYEKVIKLIQKQKNPYPIQITKGYRVQTADSFYQSENRTSSSYEANINPLVTIQEYYLNPTSFYIINHTSKQASIDLPGAAQKASLFDWNRELRSLHGSQNLQNYFEAGDLSIERQSTVLKIESKSRQDAADGRIVHESYEMVIDISTQLPTQIIHYLIHDNGEKEVCQKKIFEIDNIFNVPKICKFTEFQYLPDENGKPYIARICEGRILRGNLSVSNLNNKFVIPTGYLLNDRIANETNKIGDTFQIIDDILKNNK